MAGKGRRPRVKATAQPGAKAMAPSAHLDTAAKAEWRRTCKVLTEAGILTPLDRTIFECYCATYSRWKRAEKKALTLGEVLTHNGRAYRNPWVSISNNAQQELRILAGELGFTPTARQRLPFISKSEKSKDVSKGSIDEVARMRDRIKKGQAQ